MVIKTVSHKGFRHFVCPTCKTNIWISKEGFKGADDAGLIMERQADDD